MADPRFFTLAGPHKLGFLADLVSGQLSKTSDKEMLIHDVAPLAQAQKGQISFLDNRKYVEAFHKTKASACIIHPDIQSQASDDISLILSRNPYKAYALIAQAFYPLQKNEGKISPHAFIHTSVKLGSGSSVASGAVIEEGAILGKNCTVEANAVIGRNVVVGDDCWIGAGASLSYALIGSRVKIYPGARIGQDGFGFAMDPKGHVRVPQLGRAIIEDDVEVGANSTIDRGAGPDTLIGRGTMIDNLVQIGHNAHVGPGSVLVAQSGISGSTVLETGVVLAAQAGVAGHLKIGAGARIAAQSGVMRDVPAGAEVCGSPAVSIKQFFRQVAVLARLAGPKEE